MRITTRSYLVWLVLGLAGLLTFLIYHPMIVPLSRVNMTTDRKQAAQSAEGYLRAHGFDMKAMDELTRSVRFVPSHLQERAYQVLGFSVQDYEFLEARSPSYYWDIGWYDDAGRIVYQAVISPDGKPFGFNHYVPEDVPGAILSQDQARQIMDDFLRDKMRIDLDDYELLEVSSDRQRERMDYFLNYYSKYDFPGEVQLHLRTTVRGERVDRVITYFSQPERLRTQAVDELQREGTVNFAVVPVIMVIVFIIMSVMYIRKFHAGEIAVRAPIFVGLIYATVVALMAFNTFDAWAVLGLGGLNPALRQMSYIIFRILIGVFGAVMILLGWSIGDSIVREKWGHKLTRFDRASSGRILFPSLWPSVLIGYGAGFVAIGMWTGLTFLVTQNFPAWTESRSNVFLFTSYLPALEVIGSALTNALYFAFVGALFLVAYFKIRLRPIFGKRIPNSAIALLLMALLIAFGQNVISLYPVSWRYGIAVFVSIFLGWVFVRYDFIAVLVAGFLLNLVPYAYELVIADNFYFTASGIVAYAVGAIPFGIGLLAFLKGRPLTADELESKPSYVKLITERERMARELEIARTVQMKLLPKENPLVEGYDIAGVCIPALEVGGDYYDFIHLGNKRLGIAIGDVSGKGVPAAIYMTLTKGILQPLAGENNSPKDVLNKLNRQIYTNIERNSFVSMFYAVLDMAGHRIRFSRAGHNPAIFAQRGNAKNTLIQPRGIALGLECGIKFQEYLEEHELPLSSGDVLTFYTDGFTEAVNRHGEEYGEERFERVISKNKDASASVIVQSVVRSVKSFVGNHPQHDDMTMVVLKAL